LFVYCTEQLKLANACAFLRTTAARLIRKYPAVGDYLRDGRMCLSTVVALRDVLTAANHEELLEQAAGKTEEQVKVMVAELSPKAAPAPMLRRLAQPVVAPSRPEATASTSGPEVAAPQGSFSLAPSGPRTTVEPISKGVYVLRIAISQELKDDLERAKEIFSHVVRDGDLEKVLHECVRRAVAEHERKSRGAVKKPRPQKAPSKGRRVPAEVSRQVYARDGGACVYVGPGGERCGDRKKVQIHHVDPHGPSTVENCALRCAVHNRYEAKLDYGAEVVAAGMRGELRRAATG
jgi:hypothetical protein